MQYVIDLSSGLTRGHGVMTTRPNAFRPSAYSCAAKVDAAQGVVTRPERLRLDRRARPGGHPDADQCSPVREHPDTVDEVLTADRLDHDVYALRVGQFVGALDEVLGRVVDPVVEP